MRRTGHSCRPPGQDARRRTDGQRSDPAHPQPPDDDRRARRARRPRRTATAEARHAEPEIVGAGTGGQRCGQEPDAHGSAPPQRPGLAGQHGRHRALSSTAAPAHQAEAAATGGPTTTAAPRTLWMPAMSSKVAAPKRRETARQASSTAAPRHRSAVATPTSTAATTSEPVEVPASTTSARAAATTTSRPPGTGNPPNADQGVRVRARDDQRRRGRVGRGHFPRKPWTGKVCTRWFHPHPLQTSTT